MSGIIDITNEPAAQQGRPVIDLVCTLRLTNLVKGNSKKSGADMLVSDWEFVAPGAVPSANGPVAITGLTCKDWIVDPAGNEMARNKLTLLTRMAAAPAQVNMDDAVALRKNYVGKAFRWQVRTESKPMQTMDANGQLVPALDDKGQVVVENNYRLATLIGRAAEHDIAPEALAPY